MSLWLVIRSSSLLCLGIVSACSVPDPDLTTDASHTSDEPDAATQAAWPLGPDLHSSEGGVAALEIAEQFLTQQSYRRDALEASLLARTNGYARERLANYAVTGRWDALPEENLPAAALVLDSTGSVTNAELQTLFEGDVPTTPEQWLELGRRAFESWPAQRNYELEREVGSMPDPGRLAELGVWVDGQRRVGGLVRVAYPNGQRGVALTCISCHAQPDAKGELQHGVPSELDLGVLQGRPWPPGSVDVTDDNWDDPVAIQDLRTTRYESRLHHTGNLSNGLAELSVRVETLLITSLGALRRPPRPVAFALAYYIWWLGENARQGVPGLAAKALRAHPATALFKERCSRCHQNELGGGDWVTSEEVGTDPRVARSPMRGTGGYRVPVLLGIHERPRGHEARPIDLTDWLSPEPSDGQAAHPPGGVDDPSDRALLVELLNEAFTRR